MAQSDNEPARPAGGEAARLRDRIDRGETGDKVDFSDPSAAPLGTDDEAGTNSVDPAQLRHAKAAETTHGPTKGAAKHVAETDKAGPADLQRSRHPAWMPWAAVAVIVVAVALYLMGGS
ncbi:MAG: hypothetical protein ACU0A5_07115 [Salipiger marinus]|uniref:hypothetical protein n=1 Tax=Salipiger marinus TaxID=555512 RepID=UPI0040591E4F